MNVSELYDLTYWVTEHLDEAGIPAKYKALQAILQHNTQPSEPKQSFEAQKNDLTQSLEAVPMQRLTKDQLRYLAQLGIAQAIGQEGIDTIEDTLFRNVIDEATSAKDIQAMLAELTAGITKSNQIKTGLDEVVIAEDYEIDDEVLIRVSFTGQASMSHITDFKDWGKVWWEIGRGIAMAHDAPPEDVKVVGATRGSVVIELMAVAAIATTTSVILVRAMNVGEKVLDLKLKAAELRNYQLQNEKLAAEIEAEAEAQKTVGIERISEELANELGLKEGNQGEKSNALKNSVKLLVSFVQSGGGIDFVIPEEEQPEVGEDGEDVEVIESKYDQLRFNYQEIRRLEGSVKLLGSGDEE